MRKKNKNVDKILIDLSDRENIKIIPSNKGVIKDTEIEEFEKRFSTYYSSFYDFTELCIEKNIEKNRNLTEEHFNKSMKNAISQNELLKEMLKFSLKEEQEK